MPAPTSLDPRGKALTVTEAAPYVLAALWLAGFMAAAGRDRPAGRAAPPPADTPPTITIEAIDLPDRPSIEGPR